MLRFRGCGSFESPKDGGTPTFDLLEITKLFWWELTCSGSVHTLADIISPYCRLQDGVSSTSRGINGQINCLNRLMILRDEIQDGYYEKDMHHLILVPSSNQTRFIVSSVDKTIATKLGLILAWDCDIIVGIVIVNIESEAKFLNGYMLGDTESPSESPDEERFTVDYSLGRTLSPPYLVPKPPPIRPTVSVTVLSCENLHSRLKRLVPRNINAFVIVNVGDVSQRTKVVHNSENPVFNSVESKSSPFVFDIPEDLKVNGFIEFLVEDQKILDSDRLAGVRVPLASLQCMLDGSELRPVSIPLEIRRRHFGVSERIRRESRNSDIVSSNIQVEDEQADENTLRNRGNSLLNEGMARLKVLISKADVQQWWEIQELRARDEERERRILEAAVSAEGVSENGEERKADNSLAEEAPRSNVIDNTSASGVRWIDSDIVKECAMCSVEFSLLTRKHHCRACGKVFCGECSSCKIRIGDTMERACTTCFEVHNSSTHTKSTSNCTSERNCENVSF